MWKRDDWVPVFKKEEPRLKENYRPITVEATVNKVFEQLLSKQLSHNFDGGFSDKLTAQKVTVVKLPFCL